MSYPTVAEMQAAGMTAAQITQALAYMAAADAAATKVPTVLPLAQTNAAPIAPIIGARVASNQMLQEYATANRAAIVSGFASPTIIDRVSLAESVLQVRAHSAQVRSDVTGRAMNVTRFQSEEQMIAELEKNQFKTSTLALQGDTARSTLGGVVCTTVTLPSGRVWSAAKKGIDITAISVAPNSFAY